MPNFYLNGKMLLENKRAIGCPKALTWASWI